MIATGKMGARHDSQENSHQWLQNEERVDPHKRYVAIIAIGGN